MANLIITPASVKRVQGIGATAGVVWGAAVTDGQAVYQDPTDNLWYPTNATDAASPSQISRFGIALSSGAIGQSGVIAIGPDSRIELGAGVMVATDTIILDGVNPGQMKRAADLVAGEFLTIVGYAATDSILVMAPSVTGIVKV